VILLLYLRLRKAHKSHSNFCKLHLDWRTVPDS
jgi:hypothetical protein